MYFHWLCVFFFFVSNIRVAFCLFHSFFKFIFMICLLHSIYYPVPLPKTSFYYLMFDPDSLTIPNATVCSLLNLQYFFFFVVVSQIYGFTLYYPKYFKTTQISCDISSLLLGVTVTLHLLKLSFCFVCFCLCSVHS